MSLRPHHTCLILLGVVLLLTLIDCVLLNPHPARLDFVAPETCDQTVDMPLPQGDADPHKHWQYYVCGPSDQAFPDQKVRNANVTPHDTDAMDALWETRYRFNAPKGTRCSVGLAQCTHAGNLEPATSQDASITLRPNQYLIQLEERVTPMFESRGMILLCLALLILGLIYGWRHNDAMPKPTYSVYIAPAAFFIATLLGILFAQAAFSTLPRGTGHLTPLISHAFANLGMFFGLFMTALFFIFWMHRKASLTTDEQMPVAAEPEKKPFFCKSPLPWAAFVGFLLAVFAAIFALTIDDIEVTISDLTNEFTHYRFALMHFAMLAGISEELLYRGVIQTAIGGQKTGGLRAWLGIVLAAILFASVHIPQSTGHLMTLIPVFMVGLTSGYFRCKTQSIFPSMTMHLSYNSALMIPSLFI